MASVNLSTSSRSFDGSAGDASALGSLSPAGDAVPLAAAIRQAVAGSKAAGVHCSSCGAPCRPDQARCGECGLNRKSAAKSYLRNFRRTLTKARQLKDAHDYQGALKLLNELSETALTIEHAAKVQRRIQRVHQWEERCRGEARAAIKRAAKKIAAGSYASAVRLLKQIPEPLQDDQSRRLIEFAQQRAAQRKAAATERTPGEQPAPSDSREPQITVSTPPVMEPDAWLAELDEFNRRSLACRWTPWLFSIYAHALLLLWLYRVLIAPDPTPLEPTITLQLSADWTEPAPPPPLPVVIETTPVATETPPPEEPEPEPVPEEPVVADETVAVEEPAVAEPQVEVQAAELPVPAAEAPSLPAESPASAPPAEPPPPAKPVPQLPPAPPQAVTSGNFTVWSEPAVPVPGETYFIFIRIRLPDRITKYPRGDLSGALIGSDGYRKVIRDAREGLAPLIDQTATIMIPVVGAARPEADTVLIRSRILRQQKIVKLVYAR